MHFMIQYLIYRMWNSRLKLIDMYVNAKIKANLLFAWISAEFRAYKLELNEWVKFEYRQGRNCQFFLILRQAALFSLKNPRRWQLELPQES